MKKEENSDVRKLLDQLHSNRVSIENDRKNYDKVRQEIVEMDGNLFKVSEQWNASCRKLSEMAEVISCRRSDENMYNVKFEVLRENCEKLEKNIESSRYELRSVRKELQEVSRVILMDSTEFCKEWNCGRSGRKYRQDIQARKISELNDFKRNLEYEMDDFLLMQRSVVYAEVEKLEFIKKLEKYKAEAEVKEAGIREQLEITDKELSNLNKKEELASKDVWNQEYKKMAESIEITKKSISFLESRVSETQRVLENQRQETTPTTPIVDLNPRPNISYIGNPVYQSADEYHPPCKIRTIEHFTTSLPNVKANNKVLQNSEYTFKGPLKAARMFQFKKKASAAFNENPGLDNS